MRLDKYQVLRMPLSEIDKAIEETREQRARLLLARNGLLNSTSEQVDKDVKAWREEIDRLQVKIERAYKIHSEKEVQLSKNRTEIKKADDYIQFLSSAREIRKLQQKEKHILKLQDEIARKKGKTAQ